MFNVQGSKSVFVTLNFELETLNFNLRLLLRVR